MKPNKKILPLLLRARISSEANVHAVLRVAKELGKGANVVTVLVDNRDRYFPEYPNEHYVI